MSKYLKQLITDEISQRLDGVDDCLLANVIGLEVNNSVRLRKELRLTPPVAEPVSLFG